MQPRLILNLAYQKVSIHMPWCWLVQVLAQCCCFDIVVTKRLLKRLFRQHEYLKQQLVQSGLPLVCETIHLLIQLTQTALHLSQVVLHATDKTVTYNSLDPW